MRKFLCFAAIFGAVYFLSLPAHAQIFQNDGNTPDTSLGITAGARNRYSMTGDARDAVSNEPLTTMQVNLRSDDGRTYLSTFTDQSGRFLFDNLPRASYTITAAFLGYQSAEERVDLDAGPAIGVELRLHKLNSAANAPGGSSLTVSARELSIPAKAREDMQKGEQLATKADYAGAIKSFQKAIKEFPKYYEAYTMLGVVYLQAKDAANSESSLHKAVELSDQKYAKAYVSLAELYSETRRFSEAESAACKALEIDPKSWQASAELARAQMGLNRFSKAEESADAAIKEQPNVPELYLLRMKIHAKLPNYPAVLQDMNAYLKLVPNGDAADQVRAMRAQILQAMAKPSDNPLTGQAAGNGVKP